MDGQWPGATDNRGCALLSRLLRSEKEGLALLQAPDDLARRQALSHEVLGS
jgi:hypothetical protein